MEEVTFRVKLPGKVSEETKKIIERGSLSLRLYGFTLN